MVMEPAAHPPSFRDQVETGFRRRRPVPFVEGRLGNPVGAFPKAPHQNARDGRMGETDAEVLVRVVGLRPLFLRRKLRFANRPCSTGSAAQHKKLNVTASPALMASWAAALGPVMVATRVTWSPRGRVSRRQSAATRSSHSADVSLAERCSKLRRCAGSKSTAKSVNRSRVFGLSVCLGNFWWSECERAAAMRGSKFRSSRMRSWQIQSALAPLRAARTGAQTRFRATLLIPASMETTQRK